MASFINIMKPIDSFVGKCIQKEYVSADEAQWLRYALEKRITSLTAFVPLLIIGLLIADPATVLAFIITFCSLRTRTNGYHAKSVGGCLLYSIFVELFFLKVLPTLWNDTIAFAVLLTSTIIIWFLAPYNHPNMNLSAIEIAACARSAKRRLSTFVFLLSILCILQQEQLAEGILLGIAMTALTLALTCFPNGK